jgi:hypothetical protein
MITAIRTSPETSQLAISGEMNIVCCAVSTPASAASAPERTKAAR